MKKNFWKKKKLLITGAKGFVGKNLVKELNLKKKNYSFKFFTPTRNLLDLNNINKLNKYFLKIKPDIVIHLAGLNGGIQSNIKYPADFYYKNVTMNNNIFEICARHSVKKLVCISAGAAYPTKTKVPYREINFWNGVPNVSHLGYGLAKRLLTIQSEIYDKQHNLRSIILIPANIFGPFDNTDSFKSSVTASLIQKVKQAKLKKLKFLEMLGDPKTEREFLYVKDFIKIIIESIENQKIVGTFNIGPGKSYKIIQVVKKICKILNYKGELIWNNRKLIGDKKRLFDITKFRKKFKFKNFTNFDKAIKETIKS